MATKTMKNYYMWVTEKKPIDFVSRRDWISKEGTSEFVVTAKLAMATRRLAPRRALIVWSWNKTERKFQKNFTRNWRSNWLHRPGRIKGNHCWHKLWKHDFFSCLTCIPHSSCESFVAVTKRGNRTVHLERFQNFLVLISPLKGKLSLGVGWGSSFAHLRCVSRQPLLARCARRPKALPDLQRKTCLHSHART